MFKTLKTAAVAVIASATLASAPASAWEVWETATPSVVQPGPIAPITPTYGGFDQVETIKYGKAKVAIDTDLSALAGGIGDSVDSGAFVWEDNQVRTVSRNSGCGTCEDNNTTTVGRLKLGSAGYANSYSSGTGTADAPVISAAFGGSELHGVVKHMNVTGALTTYTGGHGQ